MLTGKVAAQDGLVPIEEVTVSGERAGPSLWRVTHKENTLYILGTITALPKKLAWRSLEVERVLDQAQQFIPTGSDVSADIGPIKAVKLYLQWRKVRKNEAAASLESVLSPTLFARFEAARLKYAPGNRNLLERRPALAAAELWRDALSRTGLTGGKDINALVVKLARARKVPRIRPQLRVDDPQGALSEIGQIPLNAEVACLSATLDRLESDLSDARERARAWSIGDINALKIQAGASQQEACWSALLSGPKISALKNNYDAAWLSTASTALEKNRSTLAVLSVSELLKPNGALEKLRALGYQMNITE